MSKSIIRTLCFAAIVAALAAWPGALSAQTSEKAAPETKATPGTNQPPVAPKKRSGSPFHGKLVAVDKLAKTISVGKRTFQITSETRLRKNGKPATLDDAVVGEECSGYIKKAEGDKLVATTVNLGPKPSAEEKAAPKESAPKGEKGDKEKKSSSLQ